MLGKLPLHDGTTQQPQGARLPLPSRFNLLSPVLALASLQRPRPHLPPIGLHCRPPALPPCLTSLPRLPASSLLQATAVGGHVYRASALRVGRTREGCSRGHRRRIDARLGLNARREMFANDPNPVRGCGRRMGRAERDPRRL